MQKFLAPFPLVRLLVPFATGVALGMITEWSISILVIASAFFFVAMIAFGMLIRKSSNYYVINGFAVFLFFGCLGITLANSAIQTQAQNATCVKQEVPVLVRIISDPESHNKSVRCRAEVLAVFKDSTIVEVDATTMLYLKRNTSSLALRYGDELWAYSGVRTPTSPMNPGEFDYAAWLKSQGIQFVCFARDEWNLVGNNTQSWLKARALQLRRYFKERLVVIGLTGQELAVSEALLLGQSSDIDPTLLASYSASGTLHVLSVSGMHVALVFVVLLKLLAPLSKRQRTKWISFAIQFFVIWFYAFMTGMSPSVLRSVMMLSVIIIGRILKRDAHLLNTLAASALLLLVINPLLIKDAGFLLSYCAVAGIVVVQPMIEKLWRPNSKLVKLIWSLISVTLAAQVFTFPLGLYFFQQFPTWFVLSNLVVIPLSTICLYAGIGLLCISWWTWAATAVAVVFGYLIQALNMTVSFTDYLPAAVLHTSVWSGGQLALLYAVILCIVIRLVYKPKLAVLLAFSCLFTLVLSVGVGRFRDAHDRNIIVFHVRNGIAVGVRIGVQVNLFTDSTTVSQTELFSNHVFPIYTKSNLDEPILQRFDTSDSIQTDICVVRAGWLFAMNKRMWLGGKNEVPKTVHECEIMLIHKNNFWMIEELRTIHPKNIVVCSEVKPKWANKWKQEAERLNVPIHFTSEEGAFVLPFN